MNFNTFSAPYQPILNNNLGANMGIVPRTGVRNVALNAPMINRVHKAKPGCSSCGKKVA